ncbi:DUF975 domain-containing protein [Candidatus Gracilibacteria bacterium]|nr:DUF975 domain-containing protein [Candidatus Gracilibacteria bacterium]NJP21501.1 DUF975 domain-containing protein [Hydrococcus sp. CRU_1_1]
MSDSLTPQQPLGSLSVGNVVSAGLRIYRDRFKLYYSLALQSYLWIFVPVYGWAKFAAISGLISRLAYSEIIEHPETVNEARRHVKPRLWTFLGAGILVSLIFLGAFVGVGLFFAIVFGILATIAQQNSALLIFISLLGIVALIGLFFGYIWLYSRLSIVELPIAIESETDASAAIGRSWNLTKGFVVRLQLIFFVAFLITLPLSLVVNLIGFFLPQDSAIAVLINLALSIVLGAFLIPFWQAIKAVIYYDLRTRKEGIDLEIRDSRP